MLLGAFAAIGQTNIKRLLAYSSIGHMGYALVGLAAGTAQGAQSVLIYMAIYVVMTIGTFGCVLLMRRNGEAVEHRRSRRARPHPADARSGAGDLHVLAGRHPAARRLLRQAVRVPGRDRCGLVALAVIGVLASVVGAFYYVRIVKVMYFDEAAEPFDRPAGREFAVIVGGAALFNLAFCLHPGPLSTRPESRRRRCCREHRASCPTATSCTLYSRLESTNDEARRLAEQGALPALWCSRASRSRTRPAWSRMGIAAGQSLCLLLLRPDCTLADRRTAVAGGEPRAGRGADRARAAPCRCPGQVAERRAGARRQGRGPAAGKRRGRGRSRRLAGHRVGRQHRERTRRHPLPCDRAALRRLPADHPSPTCWRVISARWTAWPLAPGRFAAVRPAWLALGSGIGDRVRLRLGREEVAGRFLDVTDQGALLVAQDGDRRRQITAGELLLVDR